MNKLTTSMTLISALLLAGTTQAAQVKFEGLVTSQTCQFSNFEGDTLSVKLPDVSQGELTTAGQVAGQHPFQIVLSGCTTNDTVYIKFGAANVDAANNGTLRNTTGTAENVNLQLLKGTDTVVDLNAQTDVDKQKVLDGTQAYTFDYAVQYYATGASKAGTVESTAEIAITYP